MALTPEELPAYLETIVAKVTAAPPDAAYKMAKAFEDHVRTVTLRRYAHPPFTWTPSPRYVGTPAFITGALEQSIHSRRGARTAYTAEASTGPYIIYGRIQELGGDIFPRHAKWLHWRNFNPRTGTITDWYSKHVEIPKRPYLEPAADETMANGSLTRAASVSFMKSVWG